MVDKKNPIEAGPEAELAYECAICERTYSKPGMCTVCKAALKPKGE